MINITQEPKPAKIVNEIGDEAIFDRYESVAAHEIQTSLLLAHLAGNFLSPNGYVAFNGGRPDIYLG